MINSLIQKKIPDFFNKKPKSLEDISNDNKSIKSNFTFFPEKDNTVTEDNNSVINFFPENDNTVTEDNNSVITFSPDNDNVSIITFDNTKNHRFCKNTNNSSINKEFAEYNKMRESYLIKNGLGSLLKRKNNNNI